MATAHGLAREPAFEHAEGAPGEVDGDAHLRLVHREHEAIAGDAHLVAERHAQGLAQRQRAVLDGVVLVDVEISVALEFEREAAVFGDLLEHVVEEANAGRNGDWRGVVEVHRD